jgi:UDP-glucose 4-epimerase
MDRVVITGATGMIGRALTKYLIEMGIEVYAICRPNSTKKSNIIKSDKVKILECDISDLYSLKEKINLPCDALYHFAWTGTFGDSRNDVYLQNLNVKYTLDAVKLAKELGCKVFVGAGSQAEYGTISEKISPDTPVSPNNGYGIAKYTAGNLSRILARQLGIKHIWTRILSVYGPYDNGFTMVMSSINKLLKGEKPAYTKGEQLWDYLYCDDAAKAIYLMSEKGKNEAIYCLGSSNARLLKDYITVIRDNIDKSLPLGLGQVEYGPNQVMYLCADIKNLTEDTGFYPSVDFESGIKNTINWVKQNCK